MEKFNRPLADIVYLDDDIICTSQPSSGHEGSDPDPTIIVDDE